MGQLLYGSADGIAGRGAGGWGVIRESDGMDAAERDALSSLASVWLPQTMPQFPSKEQLERRARRFRAHLAGPRLTLCMSVEAGPDHTGRPGNVISHCVAVEPVDGVRNPDWFFADGWVQPHGASQVAAARLPDEFPAPRGWPATAAWVRADGSRLDRAPWILASGMEVLRRQRRLILVAASPDEGARWASVIMWMLDPENAGRYAMLVGEDSRSMRDQDSKLPYVAVLAPDVPVPPSFAESVVDTNAGGSDDSVWGQVLVDLLVQSDDVACEVLRRRDELLARYRTDGNGEAFTLAQALQTAWYTRDGAQNFGQEALIQQLVEGVGPTIRQWPELQQLAPSTPTSAPSAPSPSVDDIYGHAAPAFDEHDAYAAVPAPALASAYEADAYDSVEEPYLTELAQSRAGGQPTAPASSASPSPSTPPPSAQPVLGPGTAHGAAMMDSALEAAARLGDLRPLHDETWLDQLMGDPQRARDLWTVAAAASWVLPNPRRLEQAVRMAGTPDRSLLRPIVERVETKHGPSRPLQDLLGGNPWQ